MKREGKQNLRARLKAEAIENADRDVEMAAECFPLEEEDWQMFETTSRKPG